MHYFCESITNIGKKQVLFDTVLFDLDGTLTDPSLGITNSIIFALSKRGINVTDRTSLYRFIGPPLLESFQMYCGFTEQQAREALADYREYFSTKGLYENLLTDDCEPTLRTLKNAGCRILLCTSKPDPFARRIIEHFHLTGYFDGMFGATMDETLCHKDEIMALALEGIPDKSKAVMVGDRHHDIDGANANGIRSIGLLCGFGSEEELRGAGATYVVKGIKDIIPIILGN